MKKKYITLEEVLALRGTDTKIYEEDCCEDTYYKFVGDLLCGYNDKGDISTVGAMFTERFKHYILEPEEFKVEKTGKYRTRDGRIAYVFFVDDFMGTYCGGIEGHKLKMDWLKNGRVKTSKVEEVRDLVEYVGD